MDNLSKRCHENVEIFVVDGGWGSWSSYSRCSVTCGVGIQQKQRTCTEPAPAHGGASCVGESVVSRNCTQVDCPGIYVSYLYFIFIARLPLIISLNIASNMFDEFSNASNQQIVFIFIILHMVFMSLY